MASPHSVGASVGTFDGKPVDAPVGTFDGAPVGAYVGTFDGAPVGTPVGAVVGVFVGSCMHVSTVGGDSTFVLSVVNTKTSGAAVQTSTIQNVKNTIVSACTIACIVSRDGGRETCCLIN